MNLPLSNLSNAVPGMLLTSPDATALSPHERNVLLGTVAEFESCQLALAKAGWNVVGELLKGHEGFYEMNHYPNGNVFDRYSHSQYYYHAHIKGGLGTWIRPHLYSRCRFRCTPSAAYGFVQERALSCVR